MSTSESPTASESSRKWMALVVLCVSLLMVTLDATVLNVALPTLVEKLHASSTDLQWIVDAYVLVFACLMLVAGSVGDRIGRKRTFLAGLVAFAACSTWAAFSGSVSMLIAARASMGIGAALIMPSTLAIITNTFTDQHERQRAIGFWAATSGAGIALGPIVAGLLLTRFAWGSVFLVNVPIAAAGFAFALTLISDSKNPDAQPPDMLGSLLSIAGLGLVLYAIIEAPTHGWSSTLVLTAGIAGMALLGAFVLWESVSPDPMLNLRFFAARDFTGAIISVALTMFGVLGALFVLTQLLQFDLAYTPLQAGLRMLPLAGAIALVAPLSSQLVHRIGARLTITIGLLLAAGGLWQMSGASTATAYGGIVAGMALLGLGAGLVIPSTAASVMGSLPEEHTGVGAGTNGTFLQAGGALGVAVIGSLLSTRYQNNMVTVLAAHPVPHQLELSILGSIGGALGVAGHVGGPHGAALAHAARSAFISGMDLGLLIAAIVALAGAALAFMILPSKRRQDRGISHNHVDNQRPASPSPMRGPRRRARLTLRTPGRQDTNAPRLHRHRERPHTTPTKDHDTERGR